MSVRVREVPGRAKNHVGLLRKKLGNIGRPHFFFGETCGNVHFEAVISAPRTSCGVVRERDLGVGFVYFGDKWG